VAEADAAEAGTVPPIAESASQRRRRWALFLGLAGGVVVLDQLTKVWVDGGFAIASRAIPAGRPGGPTELLGDLVRIAKTYNDGAIFGLFEAVAPVMAVLSMVVIAGITWFEWRHGAGAGRLVTLGLGLLLGGAIGNLIDRLRIGQVIDFVDMGLGSFRWYAWNIADAAIFLGLVTLFAAALLGDRIGPRPPRGEAGPAMPGTSDRLA
jgi:signal peptidase II